MIRRPDKNLEIDQDLIDLLHVIRSFDPERLTDTIFATAARVYFQQMFNAKTQSLQRKG